MEYQLYRSEVADEFLSRSILNRITPYVYALTYVWTVWMVCMILTINYLPVVINIIYL